MRKKLFTFLLAIVASVGTLFAESSGTCGENLTWTLSDDGVLTISGTGAMTDYSSSAPWYSSNSSITSVIISDGVTSIGSSAFSHCSSLTSVTIPNSVTSIGEGAFSGCIGLTSVTIPNSVTSIGDWAFQICSSLTSIEIPNSVTSIGAYAFCECIGLASVTIGNSVTSIENGAFSGCSSLTSVTIPNSVTSIGNYAFYNCSSLTSVTIGNSVTSIGYYAFYGCSNLTSVVWSAINHADVSNSPFNYIRTKIKSFVFSNEVEHIPSYLCYGMTSLTSLFIPSNVTSIGNYAFDKSGLTTLVFACNSNYEITGNESIPKTCSVIKGAFTVCPDTTLCYGEDLYVDEVLCNLTKTPNIKQTWTRNLTTIDGCDSIITISVLWKRVAPLADFNFTIKDAFDTPNSGSISWTVAGNTDYKYDYYTLNGNKYSNSSSSRYNLSAGEYKLVFYNEACNDSTIKYITINQLGIKVNNQYYLLDEENHTATLTYRGTSSSDYSNEYSGNITIPQVVTYSGVEYKVIGINNSTFSGCNNIKTITLESSTPLSMNYSGLSSNTIVYVPFGSLNAYKAASGWSNYTLHVIDPTHASATTGATSATITLGDSNEALYIASCGIVDGEATDGNVLEYIGLEPNSTYANLPLYINSTKGDYDTLHYSFTTSALELTTQQSKAISSTTAILLAETNMSDAEVNCGFEWKRENAPDAMAGTKVYCPVANGTMAGRLKGLKDDV